MFLIYKNNLRRFNYESDRFNPLNQVYVFNKLKRIIKGSSGVLRSFNPLNQVYVFNEKATLVGNHDVSALTF